MLKLLHNCTHPTLASKVMFKILQARLQQYVNSELPDVQDGFRKGRGRRQWHPTPVLLPGKPHGWRSLVGCSPWGRTESDTTEQLHFHFSLPCTGEGNGNTFQCSCLENHRDCEAWWAAIYGVSQSQTRLKRLSSSSSSSSNRLRMIRQRETEERILSSGID